MICKYRPQGCALIVLSRTIPIGDAEPAGRLEAIVLEDDVIAMLLEDIFDRLRTPAFDLDGLEQPHEPRMSAIVLLLGLRPLELPFLGLVAFQTRGIDVGDRIVSAIGIQIRAVTVDSGRIGRNPSA